MNCCNGGDDYLSLISKQKRYEIRRSEKNRYIAQKEELSYDNYWDFFSYSYSLRNRTPDYSKEKMERLFNAACDNNSMCLYTLRNQEKIVATSILLFDTRRSFVMFNTFDPTNKQITGASLTYAGIVDVFSNGLIYDFEGSMISSVAQYYREFNGTPEPYFVITNYSRRYKMRKNIKECIRLIKPM
ncbi:MAG: GNAT family N-acetyltransferase [Christensenellaceae bacterium]